MVQKAHLRFYLFEAHKAVIVLDNVLCFVKEGFPLLLDKLSDQRLQFGICCGRVPSQISWQRQRNEKLSNCRVLNRYFQLNPQASISLSPDMPLKAFETPADFHWTTDVLDIQYKQKFNFMANLVAVVT
ncbi:hypothetical protein PROFUN_03663 [Planoprotostelium fungivorum]|uniref:Uncharacterized protein n=1 Tax=Planoprotostelium fungivorum TaxID=1890364 RepID=A0A2P6NSH8_9EUKA|nr:hypothetical protein PROFUN_03663 [Planoprotostelium fungivorum]